MGNRLRKYFEKINVLSIISEHVNTLYDHSLLLKEGRKSSRNDAFLFLIFPIILTLFLRLLGYGITKDSNNSPVLVCFSIFSGFLFNLLVLTFDLISKTKNSIKKNKIEHTREMDLEKPNDLLISELKSHQYYQGIRLDLLKEVFSNISFTILVSLAIIAVSFIYDINIGSVLAQGPIGIYVYHIYICTLNILYVFLLIEFFLCLLMIIKRFYLLSKAELTS